MLQYYAYWIQYDTSHIVSIPIQILIRVNLYYYTIAKTLELIISDCFPTCTPDQYWKCIINNMSVIYNMPRSRRYQYQMLQNITEYM